MNTMPSPDFDHLLFHATTSRGHEPILQRELQDFGAQATRLIPGGVEFEGDITLGMRTCLWSRVCNRVHVRIGEDRLRNEKQLYQSVRALPLAQWFHPDFPIVVHAQARGAIVTNSMYATMVAKDAVCDAMRDLYGRRPGVDRENDLATALDVQIINDRVYYGISLQGAPLHKRGYRARDIDAPIRETLAAGLLMFAEWDPREPLHDPCCGSGTIVFEAAMMAADMAPGFLRSFGFQGWAHFASFESAWLLLREEAQQRRRSKIRSAILGTDIDSRNALSACRTNNVALGIEGISFAQADALLLRPMIAPGLFAFNPPYGERMGRDREAAENLLRGIGAAIRKCPEHRAALIAPTAMIESLGGRFDRTVRVANGKLDCTMGVTRRVGPKA
jgi:23S rRNA G2445 N2-methylase RlmL